MLEIRSRTLVGKNLLLLAKHYLLSEDVDVALIEQVIVYLWLHVGLQCTLTEGQNLSHRIASVQLAILSSDEGPNRVPLLDFANDTVAWHR